MFLKLRFHFSLRRDYKTFYSVCSDQNVHLNFGFTCSTMIHTLSEIRKALHFHKNTIYKSTDQRIKLSYYSGNFL